MNTPTASRMTPPAPCQPPIARRAARLGALALAALCCGCISYNPREVGAMSAYDLCEARLYSGVNLTAETKALVSDELRKRQEDCRAQVPLIDAQREFEVLDAMYGRSGP